MDRLLLIDKPKNWSSFDVVAKVRGIVRQRTGQKRPKVGHAGTLDPLATGLLILLVGSYCKRADEFMKLDKVYEVEITLGQTSTTDDAEGELSTISDKKPSLANVNDALNHFIGNIKQIPPAFSAIKVDGKRAYKMAREGQEVKLKPRSVTVYSIDKVTYTYPKITCRARVSSGTYIRSLARDIGSFLGVGAYMSNLRRTQIGDYEIKNAKSVEQVTNEL